VWEDDANYDDDGDDEDDDDDDGHGCNDDCNRPLAN
jgi:hypothetical protein